MDKRGISTVVGVMLVTLVVVFVIGVGAAGVLGSFSEIGQNPPLIDFDYAVTNDSVNITHAGGDPVRIDEVTVIFEGTDGNETRFGLENVTITGDAGDDIDKFEVGEVASHEHDVRETAWIEITIIHETTNSIISDAPNTFRIPG